MGPIVSTSDPWGFYRPQQSGHASALLVEELYPSEVQDWEFAAELDALLPGFEATTWADLESARALDDELEPDLRLGPATACPAWCVTAEDGTHLGVEHLIRPANGGSSFGYEGADVAVSLHLEQDQQTDSTPVIVLESRVNGQEHRAYLTAPEAYELRALLGGLLTDLQH